MPTASLASTTTPTAPPRRLGAAGGLLLSLLVAGTFFAAVLPTLTWVEFSNGSENLNVQTVLEMRRGGPWLVPTLLGGPRTIKPPLTAWLTAWAVSPQTVEAVGSPDPVVRERAMRELAWQVRWPALLTASLMLVATYLLGRTLGGDARLGVLAAVACGSSLLFLSHTRVATTDVQLALWVTVSSAFLAMAVLEDRWWLGCVGGGLAAGLAFMSKGPVGWVQSVLPVVVFLIASRRMDRLAEGPSPARRVPLAPVLVGLLAMLAVALPWPALVAWRYAGQWSAWWTEVTRIGAREAATDPWYDYVQLVPLLMPWTIWFIAGVVLAIRDTRQGLIAASSTSARRGLHPMALALLLTFVPVVVMSFFRDKPARYLLPMAAPAAVLIARGLLEHARTWREPDRMGRWLVRLHWLVLAAVAVGLPLAGAKWLRSAGGQEPWYPAGLAVAAASVGVVVLLAGILWHRRRSVALVVVTFALMLGVRTLFTYGYARSDGGRNEVKPLADAIFARYPRSDVYTYQCSVKSRRDLSIYLARVTIWIDDPSAIPARGGGPQVLVVGSSRRRREGSATTLPSQWVRFAELSDGSDRWEAYVREPRPASR